MSRTFRKEIPDELVLDLLKLVGVISYDDFHWFPKSMLTQNVCKEFDVLLETLSTYYYPHKLFIIERELNQNRYIQILRQVLKSKNIILESKEYVSKDFNKNKSLMYRIKPRGGDFFVNDSAVFTVTFD